jgi:hypothetical protein
MKSPLTIVAYLECFSLRKAFAATDPAHCPYRAKRHLGCQSEMAE